MTEVVHAHDIGRPEVAISERPRRPREGRGLIALQRLAGNAAVSSLVAQRQEENLPTDAGGGGGGGGGMQMINLVSLGRSGSINIKLQNGTVLDASATIG